MSALDDVLELGPPGIGVPRELQCGALSPSGLRCRKHTRHPSPLHTGFDESGAAVHWGNDAPPTKEERPMTPPEPTAVGATRFYVLTASDDLMTFTLVGVHEASGRDQAIRKQFGKNPPLCVAVSEHQWHVKKPKYRPVPDGFENVPMPDLASEAVPDDEADFAPVDDDAEAVASGDPASDEALGESDAVLGLA